MADFKLKIGRMHILAVVAIGVVAYFLISGFSLQSIGMPIDCGSDKDCLIKAARKCQAANYVNSNGTDEFRISVKGGSQEECPISLKVEKFSSLPLDLEGKEMDCTLNTKNFFISSLFGENYKFCKGSLVEFVDELSLTIANAQQTISGLIENLE